MFTSVRIPHPARFLLLPEAMILLLGLVCASAPAKVVYVNKNAPGPTHTGATWATAFTTVQAGVNAAASGDEVWVAGSTYVENILVFAGLALYGGFTGTETARAQRDWKTNEAILDGNQAGPVLILPWDGLVDGFTIRNGRCSSSTYYGAALSLGASGTGGTFTVTNNTITNNSSYVIGNVFLYGGSATIASNAICGNDAGGIYMEDGTVTIENNTIADNTHGVGVYVRKGVATIENNTIVGNTADSIGLGGIYLFGAGDKVTVRNNIVAFNNVGINASSGDWLTLSHNVVFGNGGNYLGVPDPGWANGNLPLDPLFVDRTAKDYHLLPGSHCIDTGNDVAAAPGETDMDGKPRKIGIHVDIGAYEYGATYYTMTDVSHALSLAAGLTNASSADLAWIGETAEEGVKLHDVARLARKVAGLDVNP